MENSQDGVDIDMAFAQLNLEAPNVQLSAEQQQALDAIFKGSNVFCTGAAGTGKSEVLRSAFKTLTSAGKRVGLAAPTGIVAESIGGTTIHSLFGIGVPQTATDFRHRMHKPDTASRLQTLDVLVVDEISCVAGELLDRLDVEIRELRGLDAPFGGIQLVFFGDFMQLPPVSAMMKTRDDHGSGFCPNIFTSRGEAFQSRLWAEANFVTCSLSENYRQLGDENGRFRELLEKLRLGVDMNKTQREIQELCSIDSADGKGPVVLCSKNSEVESVNSGTFEELYGDPESFTSEDTFEIPFQSPTPSTAKNDLEAIGHKLLDKCRAPHTLVLKVGARVMLLQNTRMVTDDHRLMNGSLGTVTGFAEPAVALEHLQKDLDSLLVAEAAATVKSAGALSDGHAGPGMLEYEVKNIRRQIDWLEAQQCKVPIVRFDVGVQPALVLPREFRFRTIGLGTTIRLQVPLALAWAITIHKAQGMSLSKLEVDLKSTFLPGQIYVALSRARSCRQLKVNNVNTSPPRPSVLVQQFMGGQYQLIRPWWEMLEPERLPKRWEGVDKIAELLATVTMPGLGAAGALLLRKAYEPPVGRREMEPSSPGGNVGGADGLLGVPVAHWRCEVCSCQTTCCWDARELVHELCEARPKKKVRRSSSSSGPSSSQDSRASGMSSPSQASFRGKTIKGVLRHAAEHLELDQALPLKQKIARAAAELEIDFPQNSTMIEQAKRIAAELGIEHGWL